MVEGEIFFARYPVNIDTNALPELGPGILDAVFPEADFEIILSETIPISGGSGKTSAVMLIVARALT